MIEHDIVAQDQMELVCRPRKWFSEVVVKKLKFPCDVWFIFRKILGVIPCDLELSLGNVEPNGVDAKVKSMSISRNSSHPRTWSAAGIEHT